MFYLRTGGNGSGKTLFTLQDVRNLQVETGRPVCFNIRPANDPEKPNKPYCNLKPETIAEFGWKPIRFEDWEKQEKGTIFLIDECHYDLPTRPASQKPPPHIARLTEHRSAGFDFFLLTQHPKNIDSFVRNLVQAPGWHQHVKRLAGAAPVSNFVQWDAVELQCEKFGSGKNAQIKPRPFPREVYGWYDSAYLHTGKVRIPRQVVVLAICIVAIPTLFYFGFSKAFSGGAAAKAVEASGGTGVAGQGTSTVRPKTATEYIVSYRPRIPDLMHTAPAYDELTKPKRVPVPAACVEMKSVGCKCYTQDATPYPVGLDMCRQLVAHGAFLAFQPEGERANPTQVQPVKAADSQQAGLQQPSGLTLIGGGIPTAPGPLLPPSASPGPQSRVQPGSKWSFQPGGGE
ncbi:zonular occludens toxin domain-containing protein [Variovorax gossypii]